MVKLVLVLAIGIAWFATGHERAKESERELSAIASEVAGRPVQVHCQTIVAELVDVSADAGKVEFEDGRPADDTKLKRNVCKALGRFSHDVRTPEFACVESGSRCPDRVHEEIWAATVLAHETMHLSGEVAEDAAECKAMQQTPLVAELLGASPADARAIGRYAWTQIYPEAREDYRSIDCYNGGPLDLRRGDPRWP